jgi:hypothetical protein
MSAVLPVSTREMQRTPMSGIQKILSNTIRQQSRRAALSLAVLVAVIGCLATAAPAAAQGDLNDPYDSGCINSAYIAHSGDLFDRFGTDFGHIENWYSWGCHTNWVLVVFNVRMTGSKVDIHTQGYAGSAANTSHRQCYPTDCSSTYTGGVSPTWSDMIEGADVACVDVLLYAFDLRAPGGGAVVPTETVSPVSMGGYGTDDALCA